MTDAIATAILGIDTLWGGDVLCASGTGRFIADSWFSDEPLPRAYTLPEAARVRATGGVSAESPDLAAIDAYLVQVDIPGAIQAVKSLPGDYLAGLALCFETMWDLAMEMIGRGVTTFAYLQNLYWRRAAGFEASVLTMNTRAATLFEGIANNAILMAYGVTEIDQLPDPDLQIGVLLALLQDDAKNQSSYLTWGEGAAQSDVARTLRSNFLVSPERADKLSGAWGRHPLLGRMYLPCYRAGTRRVADLRRRYPAERVFPALFGSRGLVDITTVESAV